MTDPSALPSGLGRGVAAALLLFAARLEVFGVIALPALVCAHWNIFDEVVDTTEEVAVVLQVDPDFGNRLVYSVVAATVKSSFSFAVVVVMMVYGVVSIEVSFVSMVSWKWCPLAVYEEGFLCCWVLGVVSEVCKEDSHP